MHVMLHSELERFHFSGWLSAGQGKGKGDDAQKTCLRRKQWSAKFHIVGRSWMVLQGPVGCVGLEFWMQELLESD